MFSSTRTTDLCTQIVVDNEHEPLGPGGTRALTTAIMGTAEVRTEHDVK